MPLQLLIFERNRKLHLSPRVACDHVHVPVRGTHSHVCASMHTCITLPGTHTLCMLALYLCTQSHSLHFPPNVFSTNVPGPTFLEGMRFPDHTTISVLAHSRMWYGRAFSGGCVISIPGSQHSRVLSVGLMVVAMTETCK